MRSLTLLLLPLAVAAGWLLCDTRAADPARKDGGPAVGIDKRVPWTTSRVKGSPEPPPEYRSEVAFPKLKFAEPLDLAFVPGRNRLAVAERHGKVFTFANDPPRPTKADLLLDTQDDHLRHRLPPAISPRTATSTSPPSSTPTRTTAPAARWCATRRRATRRALRPGLAKGHLRVAVRRPQRRLPEVRAGRLPVHRHRRRQRHRRPAPDRAGRQRRARRPSCASTWTTPDDGKAYGVPEGQPVRDARRGRGRRSGPTACGSRGSSASTARRGDLWCGEVGQDLWEMRLPDRERRQLRLVASWRGRTPSGPERKKGPTPILPPVVEHPHSEFRSLTGGYVYRGERLKGLAGSLRLRRLRHRPRLGLPLRRQEGERAPRADEDPGPRRQLRRGRGRRAVLPRLRRRPAAPAGPAAEGRRQRRLPAGS